MNGVKLDLDPYTAFLSLSENAEQGFFLEGWGEGKYCFFGIDPVDTYQGEFGSKEWERLNKERDKIKTPGELEMFKSGWVGLIGYDMGRNFENFKNPNQIGMQLPDFLVGKYEKTVWIDLDTDLWYLNGGIKTDGLCNDVNLPPVSVVNKKLLVTEEEHESWVEKTKKYIYDGDIFQANLAHPIEYEFEGNPLDLYRRIHKYNPSPHAGVYFDKTLDFYLLSNSPELLYEVKGNRIYTKPIAGTRRRGSDAKEDAQFKQELNEVAKEQAEHLMLVDLERNDLGRLCEYGTVEVSRLGAIEEYKNVFHLVSTVEGQLRDGLTPSQIFKALFPGGTITGAPKIRSMEIIYEMEKHRRNFYTGALGWLSNEGRQEWNILIRTAQIKNDKIHLHVGGGIVYDSDAHREYQETWNKAAAWEKILGE